MLLFSQKKLQEGNVRLCIVLSHLSNTVYLSRITYMCSNCLYRTRLFVVKPLVGKQLWIEKTTFCGLLKCISTIQFTFHCSEIWVWKIERFLNWWWSTFGCMFNCSAELFMSGKWGVKTRWLFNHNFPQANMQSINLTLMGHTDHKTWYMLQIKRSKWFSNPKQQLFLIILCD